MASGGVNGMAVATITAGAVLTYAGFRGVSPLQALRDIASGAPPAVSGTSAGLDTGTAGLAAIGAAAAVAGTSATTAGSGLVRAAFTHANERYSQTKRWQAGFSDCSSFVGKSFRDIGITPPGPSLAASYLIWPKVYKVARSALSPGDLCANAGHIIIATGPNAAIGQENSRQNVQVGTPENLMMGTGSFVCLRYRWPAGSGTAASAASAAAGGAGVR